jgi:predicted 3-demethylubiquinone-9 3-methyltransferase (glyoxalase superfamily)
MQKIVTFLMFDDQAEEAVRFYASVFKENAEVLSPLSLRLFGQDFYTYNGGPSFSFSQGMSLFVHCEDQAEVDYYWERLGEGGHHDQCGWLQDRFGVSWQVVPVAFLRLSSDPDPEKSRRVVEAMLKMTKLDVAQLEAAYRGE